MHIERSNKFRLSVRIIGILFRLDEFAVADACSVRVLPIQFRVLALPEDFGDFDDESLFSSEESFEDDDYFDEE